MVNIFRLTQNLVTHKVNLDDIKVLESFHLQNVGRQDWEWRGPSCVRGNLIFFIMFDNVKGVIG
jgi:hypothetical protein